MVALSTRLSKTRFLAGLQCVRRLWLETYSRELGTYSAQQQHQFARGYAFNAAAQQWLGAGLEIPLALDQDAALAATAQHMPLIRAQKAWLFEGAFLADGLVVRVDALAWRSGWRLVEAKASLEVRAHYLWDCAVQAYTMQAAGHTPSTVFLLLQAPACGFRLQNVSESCAALLAQVPQKRAQFEQILAGTEPQIRPGGHCDRPHACPFKRHCSR